MTRLREDDKSFSYITENIEDYAIILLNKDGVIEDWNKGAQKIKGYEASEIVGKSFKIFYTPEDQQSKVPDKLIASAIKNNKALNEGWRVRKDGTKFWGSISITAIKNKDNEIEGFIKVTRDLSERKKAEELLLQKNTMLLEAERTAAMCSWTWDVTTDAFGWSEAACDIFNMRVQYAMNYNRFLRSVHKDDRVNVQLATNEILNSGRAREFTFRINDGAKKKKIVLVCIGRIIKDENNTVERITGTLQDITEKMTYVNSIREKNRKLAEIAQLQSHIVRSQVANILGICEVLDIESIAGEENKELIRELKKSTEKLDTITRNIVDKTYDSSQISLPGGWK